MPIAKEVLSIGFTVVALPGNYVTKEAVKANGWESKVDDGPDYDSIAGSKDAKAPKSAAVSKKAE